MRLPELKGRLGQGSLAMLHPRVDVTPAAWDKRQEDRAGDTRGSRGRRGQRAWGRGGDVETGGAGGSPAASLLALRNGWTGLGRKHHKWSRHAFGHDVSQRVVKAAASGRSWKTGSSTGGGGRGGPEPEVIKQGRSQQLPKPGLPGREQAGPPPAVGPELEEMRWSGSPAPGEVSSRLLLDTEAPKSGGGDSCLLRPAAAGGMGTVPGVRPVRLCHGNT